MDSEDLKSELYEAIKLGDFALCERLLMSGVEVNGSNNLFYMSALQTSILYRQFEIMKLLIDYGADVNAIDKGGHSVLQYTIKFGYFEYVELALKHGANILYKDYFGNTACHTAIFKYKPHIVFLIMDEEAIDEFRKDYIKTVELILANGGKVDVLNLVGVTALHHVICENLVDAVELLLEYGADITIPFSNGMSTLDLANKYSPESVKLIKMHGLRGSATKSAVRATTCNEKTDL